MLGNAVPSLLAEVLAREIRRQLFDDVEELGPLKLLPPARRPIPPREEPAPLPAKYLHLIGEHADHPGEGRGRGARRITLPADAGLIVAK
jgi:DNA (cytosine-5)-methyltransferase 1